MNEKEKMINDIDFDRAGFGSKQGTLDEARKKDKSITVNAINEVFKKTVEQKRRPVGTNSFVAPHSAYQYQTALVFINDMKNHIFKVGMLTIDVFDKFMYVVHIRGKTEEDLASGIIESIHKMGKKPKIVYTDDEGATSKESIQTYFKEQNIEHHITRAHPNFSESAIRFLKICCIGGFKQMKKR